MSLSRPVYDSDVRHCSRCRWRLVRPAQAVEAGDPFADDEVQPASSRRWPQPQVRTEIRPTFAASIRRAAAVGNSGSGAGCRRSGR